MEHQYLLTFVRDDVNSYSWFESEEELNEFIELNADRISVNEKMHILGARNLD